MKKIVFNAKTGKSKTVSMSEKDIEEITNTEIPDKTYLDNRKELYEKNEMSGTLPGTPQDNIDEMWKALDALASGDNLPAKAVNIIRIRKVIKALFRKG